MYYLLLSSGRTGTTFLTDAIQLCCQEITVLQEPIPSRTIHMLANSADFGFPTRNAATLLHRLSQKVWSSRVKGALLEVNPFVSPIAHLLTPTENMNKVLMVVRHPDSWIDSMLNFRGYAWRAKVTPTLPFVYARPSDAKAHWGELSEEEKFAWRWVEINRNILQCADNGFELLTIRYEDLFGAAGLNMDVLDKVISFYGLTKSVSLDQERIVKFRKNPSNRKGKLAWYEKKPEMKKSIDIITESMRQKFNYE